MDPIDIIISYKDQIDHKKIYPCSNSKPEITTSCWSFAHNEDTEESCIIEIEQCEQTDEHCVKVIDDIDFANFKFYDGTPVICKDFKSYFLIGVLKNNRSQNSNLNMNNVPGNLVEYINENYEVGKAEIDENIELDYDGSDFQKPDVLPKKSGCADDDNMDNDFGYSESNGKRPFIKILRRPNKELFLRYGYAICCPSISSKQSSNWNESRF